MVTNGFGTPKSTSFQKRNIDWHQQPPTEKVKKFNVLFHDSTNFFFKTSNRAEFQNLDDSKVLSSFFQVLESLFKSIEYQIILYILNHQI